MICDQICKKVRYKCIIDLIDWRKNDDPLASTDNCTSLLPTLLGRSHGSSQAKPTLNLKGFFFIHWVTLANSYLQPGLQHHLRYGNISLCWGGIEYKKSQTRPSTNIDAPYISATETSLSGCGEQRHLQLPALHGEGRQRLAQGLVCSSWEWTLGAVHLWGSSGVHPTPLALAKPGAPPFALTLTRVSLNNRTPTHCCEQRPMRAMEWW